MRVLVLGGTAFIGPPTVRRLASAGHEIALFNRGKRSADLPEGLARFTGDRAEFATHAPALRDFRPDVVLDMWPLSEADGRAVIETFRGVASRVVAVSSQDVYRAFGVLTGFEPGPVDPAPLTEDAPLRSRFFLYRELSPRLHDYEKILVERAVLADPGLPGTILRLPMVYGPGDYQHRLFPHLKRMDDGRRAILFSERTAGARHSRAYVEDVAHAIALAVEGAQAVGRIYNVAEADALTELEWARKIAQTAQWNGELAVLPEDVLPPHLASSGVPEQPMAADSARIRAELGYAETAAPEEALRRTVAWERANPPERIDKGSFDYAAEDQALRGRNNLGDKGLQRRGAGS